MDDFSQALVAAMNTPDSSLDGMSEDELRSGINRLIQFGYDDEKLAADDARIAAEAKAARKLAKKAAKKGL
jgi:hypothetical protein